MEVRTKPHFPPVTFTNDSLKTLSKMKYTRDSALHIEGSSLWLTTVLRIQTTHNFSLLWVSFSLVASNASTDYPADRADELHGKHTLFGRTVGDTIFSSLVFQSQSYINFNKN